MLKQKESTQLTISEWFLMNATIGQTTSELIYSFFGAHMREYNA